jgi:hypothetical protein
MDFNDPDPELAEMLRDAEARFAEFKNRRIYRQLTPEIIATIPDDNLQQAIIDFIWLKIGEDWKHDVEKVPLLGPGFSAIYFLSALETEVNNGGFYQFFYNRGTGAVVQAKDGANLLGLSALSGLITKALQIEERERHKMQGVKQVGTVKAFFDSYKDISFEAVDDDYFKLKVDFEAPIVAFIRTHPELFEGQVAT